MFWTPSPLVNPLPVEIINQTAWWVQWLPFAGSVIIATAAFVGVILSNRTSRRAIDAAPELEREKWHRDNLLRICSEAVRVSREIGRHYNEAAAVSLKLSNSEDFDNAFWEYMDAAQAAIDKVAPLSYDLALLGEHELYMDLQEIRQVGEFVAPAFKQYHEYLVANRARIQAGKGPDGLPEAELHGSLPCRRYNKAVQHLNRAHIDFQFAAQRKISPGSLPEGKLSKSVESDFPPIPLGMSQNPFRRPSPLDWNAGDTAESEPKD